MKIATLSSILFLAVAAPSMHASTYLVTINTSSLAVPATSGFLDLLFNNGGGSFDPITASISNFAAPGAILNAGSVATQGTVAGILPSDITIGNDNAEYLEALTFGTSINFLIQFADTPSGTGSGSTFSLSLLNSTLDGAFLTSDVNDGNILKFDIDNKGGVATTTFLNAGGSPSVVTVSAIPEPGTWAMCAAGAIAFAFLRRQRA